MYPIFRSVVDFAIPFVTTDNVNSCIPFNMQKLVLFKQRRKRSNASDFGDSSASLSKRRNISKPNLPASPEEEPIAAEPSSASTPSVVMNPTAAIQSTASVVNASTKSLGGLSTPSTTSPKLNFFQKFTRKASNTFKKKPARRAGNNDNSSGSSSSASSGDDAMTNDTSVNGTPIRRGGTLRSSTIPEVAITPTTDSSRSASPAASIRTVFRVNPYTGRPAQQYDIDFLSPRAAAARARRGSNSRRSPRFIPAGRRASTSAASSFPPTRTPAEFTSSSLPAGFPTRSSSLRHSNEFPFNPRVDGLLADDSDLYHSGPPTPVSAQPPQFPAASPALIGSAGSPPPSLDKPLPTLPQELASLATQLPLSPAPPAGDDVFYDASPAYHSAIGVAVPLTPEAAAAASTAASSVVSLTGFPTPPSSHRQQAFMHKLPPTPVSQPVPSNSPALGYCCPSSAPEEGEGEAAVSSGSYTPPTPTPSSRTPATAAATVEKPATLPTFRLFPSQIDDRVLEARLNQIRATIGVDVDNADVEKDDADKAVVEDSFMLGSDDDEGGMGPLISSSPAQYNRESLTSILTETTGRSFVTAVEDVEMEDVEMEQSDEEEEMNDSTLVDVDGSTLIAEGAAESSDHQMLLSSSNSDNENDDSYVHAGDSTLDGTTLIAEVQEASLLANMNVDEEEAESEPATFQIVSKDGANTDVAVHVHDADTASTDEGSDGSSDNDDVALPLCVSRSGPPKLSTKLIEGKMTWEYEWRSHDYEPTWVSEPSLDAIKEIAQSHYRISGLPNDDITVTYLAEGAFNKVYIIASIDSEGNLHECIFRCGVPNCPWYKTQAEVAIMEFVRRNTKIPVPKVFAFDSSMENPIGLEWMLMEKINGRSYRDVEDDLDFDTKVKLHHQVAEWIDELSKLKFDSIGRLYHDWDRPLTDNNSYKVGPLCTGEFNSDLRLDYNINRGPFRTFESLYTAHINLHLSEVHDPRHRQRVEAWNKQEEMEAAGEEIEEEVPETQHSLESFERIPQLCFILLSILPTALRGKKLGPGSTTLHNFDISKNNILVDDGGNPLALIDWEAAWVTVPNSINRYPPLVNEHAKGREPAPWDSDKEKDEDRLEKEKDWEEVLLKREFERRLEELDSPHLKTGDGQDPELTRLDEFFGMIDSLDMEYLVEHPWVQSMRDKMMDIF